MGKYHEIKARNGTAWVQVVEGNVINQRSERWSETHVSSSGGGGYVDGHGRGHINAPTISSTVVNRHVNDFWVRESDGTEHNFKLTDSNFPVAEGQTIRICWGGGKQKTGPYLYAYNYNSKEAFDFIHGGWWAWARASGLLKYPLLYRVPMRWLPTIFFLTMALMAPNFIAVPRSVATDVERIVHRSEDGQDRFNRDGSFQNVIIAPTVRFFGAFNAADGLRIIPKLLDPVRAFRLWTADANATVLEDEANGSGSLDKNRIYLPGERAPKNTFFGQIFAKERRSAMVNLAVFSLFAWMFVMIVLEILGFFFFRVWWRAGASNKLRARVIAAFNSPM
jgi:hypothetical protein